MMQWWKSSIIYEIFPRSFNDSNGDGIGDIRGIIEKLDYLEALGVDALWLCPIFSSANVDSGYDVMDYYSIWDDLGTMSDFDELVEQMHQRGMKLILDVVLNHTSSLHPWFVESRKGKENKYRDYYIWRKGVDGKEPNNWLSSKMGGSVWTYDEKTDEYYLHLYAEEQPDLNWDNEHVRKEVFEILKFWIRKGVDGFRFDVINKIAKAPGLPNVDGDEDAEKDYQPAECFYQNLPQVNEFLKEMNREVFQNTHSKSVLRLGQTSGVSYDQAREFVRDGHQLDLFLQFDHMEMNRDERFNKKNFDFIAFKQSISQWQQAMESEGWNTVFFGSHDAPRMVSNFGDDGPFRKRSAKMLATLQLMLKGTPIIYQGEEIGMTNAPFDRIEQYKDERTLAIYRERINKGENPSNVLEDLKQFSRDHARTPMQWNSGSYAGFSTIAPWMELNPNFKQINVEKAEQDPTSILHYYKQCIQIRKSATIQTILNEGNFQLILPNDPTIFSYLVKKESEGLLVLANFSQQTRNIQMMDLIPYIYEVKLIHGNMKEKSLSLEVNNICCHPYEVMTFYIKCK